MRFRPRALSFRGENTMFPLGLGRAAPYRRLAFCLFQKQNALGTGSCGALPRLKWVMMPYPREERPPLFPFSLFQHFLSTGERPFHVEVRMEPRYCSFCVLFWENRREDFVNYDITYYFYNIFFDCSMDGEKICLCVSFVKNTVSVLRISVIIS